MDPPPYEWTDVESVKVLSSWRDISGVRDPALRLGVGKGRQAPVLFVWKDLCNTGCGNETGQQPLLGWNCRPRLGVGGRGSPISWPPLTRAELLLHWSRGRARADCNQDVIGAHCSYKELVVDFPEWLFPYSKFPEMSGCFLKLSFIIFISQSVSLLGKELPGLLTPLFWKFYFWLYHYYTQNCQRLTISY